MGLEKLNKRIENLDRRIGQFDSQSSVDNLKKVYKVNKEIHQINKHIDKLHKPKKKIAPIMLAVLLLALITAGLFLGPQLVGYVIKAEETITYTQQLDLLILKSQNITWTLEQYPEQFNLESVKLTGQVVGNGTFRVYLEGDYGRRFLIMDSNSVREQGLVGITGYAVFNESSVNESYNESEYRENETTDLVENKTATQPENLTEQPENITTEPEATDTEIKRLEEKIDEQSRLISEIKTQLENLTEEIRSLRQTQATTEPVITEEITVEPEIPEEAKAPNETISEVEPTIEEPETKPARERIDFEDVCVETCMLPEGLNSTSYKLVIEIEEAILEIKSIKYEVREIIPVNISEVTVDVMIKDSGEDEVKADVLFADETGETVTEFTEDSGKGKKLKLAKGKYKVRITPRAHVIKSIEIDDLEVKENLTEFIRIDDTPEIGTNSRWIEVYAIDPTSVNYSSAEITATAKGTELWKCKDWNFTEQRCYGNWTKIAFISPGQDYSVVITPEDPALAELNGTFFDGFESGSLETNNWTTGGTGTPWTLSTDNTYQGNYVLYGEPWGGEATVETNIDTTNYQNITFSYYRQDSGLDAGEYLAADWYNGTTWTELEATETGWGYLLRNWSLPEDANNNPDFKIRFRCNADKNNEECYIDNVRVSGIEIDTTPPAIITNLNESYVGYTWIYWNWTNPPDADFDHTEVWINGTFQANVYAPDNYYNATSLSSGIGYEIQTRTVDTSGNINTTWINDTAITLSDTTPPATITNLNESATGMTWIYWNWTNPPDVDFSHVKVWINGTFYDNVSAPTNYYNATGLNPGTGYEIQTRTVDTSNNINTTWVNDSATTNVSLDITSPVINYIIDTPDPIGVAGVIEIFANITDDVAVSAAWAEINGTIYYMSQGKESEFAYLFFDGFESGSLATNNWITGGTGTPWTLSTDNTYQGSYVLYGEPWGGEATVETAIDTTGYQNITLSYYRQDSGLDAGEHLAADWYDGTAWIELEATITGWGYLLRSWSLPEGANNNPNFKIRFRCNADRNNEECYIDNVNITAYTIEWGPDFWNLSYNATGLEVGFHNYTVYAVDTSNNPAIPVTTNFTVNDTLPPNVLLVSPADNSWTTDTTPDFAFNAADNFVNTTECELFINNTSYGTNLSVFNSVLTTITASPSLADGGYNWYVNCTDNTSNTGMSEVRTINIDTIRPVITWSNATNGTGGKIVTQGYDAVIKANITEYGKLNYTTVQAIYPDGYYSSIFDMNCSGAVPYYNCSHNWTLTSRIGQYNMSLYAYDYARQSSLPTDPGAKTTFNVTCNTVGDGICTDYKACAGIDPDCVCAGLQLNESATNYTIDNCYFRMVIAKTDINLTYLSYNQGEGITNKSATAHIGDIIDFYSYFFGDETLFLERIGIYYNNITISPLDGDSITIIENSSDKITIRAIYNDSNIKLMKYIIVMNDTDYYISKFDIENIGQENITGIEFRQYKDGDMATETNQETRDKKVTFECEPKKKIETVINEAVLNETRNSKYGECYYTVQGDAKGNKNGGVFTAGEFSYVIVSQTKTNDSEIIPNKPIVDDEAIAQSDVAQTYVSGIPLLGPNESTVLIESGGVSDDPVVIGQIIDDFVEEHYVVIEDPQIRNSTSQLFAIGSNVDFDMTVDISNQGAVNETNLVLEAYIYDFNNIMKENKNKTIASLLVDESINNFVIGSSNSNNWASGKYMLKVILYYSNYSLVDDAVIYFNVTETVIPIIHWVNDTPDPVTQGQPINFTANVTDNINVSKVWLTINNTNYTMNYSGNDIYYYDQFDTNITPGTYSYTVYANDTDNNLATPMTGTFTIQVIGVEITSIIIQPDDDNITPGAQIYPIEASNRTVNLTANITNATGIDSCLISIYEPQGSLAFNLTGTIQSVNAQTQCFAQWEMDYWRTAGLWNITVFVNQTDSSSVTDYTNFTYIALKSITLSTQTISFVGVPNTLVNSTDAYPLTIWNTGNEIINLSIKGEDFVGVTAPSYVIGVSNATYNETDTGTFKPLTKVFADTYYDLVPTNYTYLYFRGSIPPLFKAQSYQANISIRGE